MDNLKQSNNLEQIGLINALNLNNTDVYEARFNLLGFFQTLNKIDQRLNNNENVYENNKRKRGDLPSPI